MSEVVEEKIEKVQIVFDATELDNFEMCQLRWHMIHGRNVGPKYTESYFEKGSLLHYILEQYYNYKKEHLGEIIPQTEIERVVEMGRLKSLDYEGMNLDEVGETIFQFREYHRNYEDENIIPVHVEEVFLVKIYEDEVMEIYITGKPDLIFRYPNDSRLCVMDHKRMSREFPYSPMRNQFLLYATAIGADTVIVNKVGFQKTKKLADRMVRTPFIYNDDIKEEWKQEVIMRAKEMLLAQQLGYYPRNRTSCEKFNGCFLQRYCTTRPKAREFLIGTEYIIGKPWDVGSSL